MLKYDCWMSNAAFFMHELCCIVASTLPVYWIYPHGWKNRTTPSDKIITFPVIFFDYAIVLKMGQIIKL